MPNQQSQSTEGNFLHTKTHFKLIKPAISHVGIF